MCLKKRLPATQINQWNKFPFKLMISDIIKKASQDEQQTQTTLITNINYIQNFTTIFLKNLLTSQNSVR